MTTVRRTITIPVELDVAIASLATENHNNYSRYISDRLIMNKAIQEMILRLEKLPPMPDIDPREIKSEISIPKIRGLQKEEQIVT